MAIKSGTLLKLYNNSAVLEDATDVTVTMDKTVINVTSKDSNYWRDLLSGTRSMSISFNAFVDYGATEGYDEIVTDFNSNNTVTFEVSTGVTGDSDITGTGIVTSLSKTGALDDGTKYSGTIEVTGAPTFGTV